MSANRSRGGPRYEAAIHEFATDALVDADAAASALWTCPRCGHRFVSANMWHSCSRFSLDDAFARSRPDVRAAFDRFVELVERCGPVVVVPQKTRIVLMVKVRFAGATRIRRDSMRLSFALPRAVDRPWITAHDFYGPRWIAHGFEVRVPTDLEIPDLPALLCESYHQLGNRESLPARRGPRAEPR